MFDRINEADWKTFKPVRERAVERFCERVLAEAEGIRSDASKSQHARYIDLYRLMRDRDKELARVFDHLRRSTAVMQLAAFRSLGLVTDEEYMRFTAPTREVIDTLLKPLS